MNKRKFYNKYFIPINERDPIFWQTKNVDLFKADIYSLGLTLVEAAICKRLKHMNAFKSEEKTIYDTIHKLQYPIQVKQVLI